MSDTVVLNSMEGQAFTVLTKVASMSRTMRDLMADVAEGEAIPLPTVSGKVLEKVIKFCQHHVDDTAPAIPPIDMEAKRVELTDKPVEIPTWDKEFCDAMDQEAIMEVIIAANYLDVRPLLDLCCRHVAQSVVGKTPKDIYAMFKCETELTPEEETEIRKENPWLEDQ